MKFRSWVVSTCSTRAASSPPLRSDTCSNFSDIQSHSPSSTSNLSLLTLPSLPSLQKQLSLDSALHPPNSTIKPPAASPINFLALNDNLLYAASGNIINVYETANFTLLDTFNAGIAKDSTGSVKSIAFLDGKVCTAHQDCKIRVWKLNQKQHRLIATLPTLNDRLRRLILPRNYVSVGRHKKKLWVKHHDAVSGLAAAACQNEGEGEGFVVSVSWDRSIKVWEPRKLRCSESINKAHEDAINAVVISKNGLIYTGSADKRIKAWKKEGNKYGLVATLEKHKSAVNALALNLEGSVLFSGSCDRSILVWEREDSADHMAVTGALRGHTRAVLCLMTTVQDLLVSGSGDGTVRIWQRGGNDGSFCCLHVVDGQWTPVKSLVVEKIWGGGGVRVFGGSLDGEIRVWEMGEKE